MVDSLSKIPNFFSVKTKEELYEEYKKDYKKFFIKNVLENIKEEIILGCSDFPEIEQNVKNYLAKISIDDVVNIVENTLQSCFDRAWEDYEYDI